ncbi:MAG: hypothetical protein M3R09_04760 [Actinomycetota bacterium]|nr:hypothetical protein [Actinomycetota bacterium]
MLANEGLDGLVSLTVIEIPESLLAPVLAEHHGEPDYDDDGGDGVRR